MESPTPTTGRLSLSNISLASSEELVAEILRRIGEDPERTGIKNTPARVVRSWREIYGGYQQTPEELLDVRFAEPGFNEMVIMRNVEFFSSCEHHMLPFSGIAHVGYLPGEEKVFGASKLARLVDLFACRLQVQERLTSQIATALYATKICSGVGVTIEAKHMCMSCRGIRKQTSEMVTTVLLGTFKEDPSTKQEFFMKTPVRIL